MTRCIYGIRDSVFLWFGCNVFEGFAGNSGLTRSVQLELGKDQSWYGTTDRTNLFRAQMLWLLQYSFIARLFMVVIFSFFFSFLSGRCLVCSLGLLCTADPVHQ